MAAGRWMDEIEHGSAEIVAETHEDAAELCGSKGEARRRRLDRQA